MSRLLNFELLYKIYTIVYYKLLNLRITTYKIIYYILSSKNIHLLLNHLSHTKLLKCQFACYSESYLLFNKVI